MILKRRGIYQADFINLINFLTYGNGDNDDNCLESTDIIISQDDIVPGFEPVVMRDGEGWNGIIPFCKLISCKHTYDNIDDLLWEVVIEIPDKIDVGMVKESGDAHSVKGTGTLYPVNTDRFVLKINQIIRGK